MIGWGLLVATGLVVLGLVVALNLWEARCRARLTPEERAAEDDELREEVGRW